MASVVAAADLLMDVAQGQSWVPRQELDIVYIDKHGKLAFDDFLSPGLARSAKPASDYDQGVKEYSRVLLPMSAQAHWWWNPSQSDDHSSFTGKLRDHIAQGFGLGDVQQGKVITLIKRDAKAPRALANHSDVQHALQSTLPEYSVNSVSFDGGMPMRDQLQHILQTKLLIGTHGAGLTWGLYLLPNAGILEIDGPGQEKANFFSGLSAWTNHAYRRYQDPALSNLKRDWQTATIADPQGVAQTARAMLEELE
jgi:hypothetical protein